MSTYGNQWQLVFKSPLNNSTSKSLFSFPKQERFKDIKKSYCNQPYYDLPSVKEKRQTSLGYGKKYDFTKNTIKTPSANHYNLIGIFEQNKNKNKGKTVGVGREKMQQGGIGATNSKYVPGPGNYKLSDTKSQISYSMRPKSEANSIFNFKNKAGIPGPGQYTFSNGDLNKTGKQFNSKYQSSKAYLINPSKSTSSFEGFKISKTPGPGQYKETVLQKDGRYTQSRYHNIKYGSFSSSKRNFFGVGNAAPGPGSYRLPSEFGYYESKTQRNFNNNNSQMGSTLRSFKRPDTTQTENVRKRPGTQQSQLNNNNNFRVQTAATGQRTRKPLLKQENEQEQVASSQAKQQSENEEKKTQKNEQKKELENQDANNEATKINQQNSEVNNLNQNGNSNENQNQNNEQQYQQVQVQKDDNQQEINNQEKLQQDPAN